jgi:hypothetical protein
MGLLENKQFMIILAEIHDMKEKKSFFFLYLPKFLKNPNFVFPLIDYYKGKKN